MNELVIWYIDENGEEINKEFKTLKDFIEYMESIDYPTINYENVKALFNYIDEDVFDTISDLLEFCREKVEEDEEPTEEVSEEETDESVELETTVEEETVVEEEETEPQQLIEE